MANFILKDDKVILHCSNWAMEALYENLVDIIKKSKNKKLHEFVAALNQDDYGRGMIYVELNDYFGTDLDSIMELKAAVQQIIDTEHTAKKYPPFFLDMLEQFKNNLVSQSA